MTQAQETPPCGVTDVEFVGWIVRAAVAQPDRQALGVDGADLRQHVRPGRHGLRRFWRYLRLFAVRQAKGRSNSATTSSLFDRSRPERRHDSTGCCSIIWAGRQLRKSIGISRVPTSSITSTSACNVCITWLSAGSGHRRVDAQPLRLGPTPTTGARPGAAERRAIYWPGITNFGTGGWSKKIRATSMSSAFTAAGASAVWRAGACPRSRRYSTLTHFFFCALAGRGLVADLDSAAAEVDYLRRSANSRWNALSRSLDMLYLSEPDRAIVMRVAGTDRRVEPFCVTGSPVAFLHPGRPMAGDLLQLMRWGALRKASV